MEKLKCKVCGCTHAEPDVDQQSSYGMIDRYSGIEIGEISIEATHLLICTNCGELVAQKVEHYGSEVKFKHGKCTGTVSVTNNDIFVDEVSEGEDTMSLYRTVVTVSCSKCSAEGELQLLEIVPYSDFEEV